MPEKDSESILFVLPDTMEEALWTLPAISQYLENRLVTIETIKDAVTGLTAPARPLLTQITASCSLLEMHPLLKACWKGMNVVSEVTDELRNSSELLICLDSAVLYDLTKTIKKHITESIGIQIGSQSMVVLPTIAQPVACEKSGSVLVVKRYRYDSARNWTWKHEYEFVKMGKEAGLEIRKTSGEESFEELCKMIAEASVIVGVRGTATLLASCFGKVVMELNPEGYEHKEWMAKWDNQAYRMIFGDLHDMVPWFVWDRTNKLVAEMSKMRGPGLWVTSSEIMSAEVSETVVG